jgi:hypothetical protein
MSKVIHKLTPHGALYLIDTNQYCSSRLWKNPQLHLPCFITSHYMHRKKPSEIIKSLLSCSGNHVVLHSVLGDSMHRSTSGVTLFGHLRFCGAYWRSWTATRKNAFTFQRTSDFVLTMLAVRLVELISKSIVNRMTACSYHCISTGHTDHEAYRSMLCALDNTSDLITALQGDFRIQQPSIAARQYWNLRTWRDAYPYAQPILCVPIIRKRASMASTYGNIQRHQQIA